MQRTTDEQEKRIKVTRIELQEAIEALEDTIELLSEELDVLDTDMGNMASKTHEDWLEIHERRFEVAEEIIRSVRANRLMREQVTKMPPVYRVPDAY